MNYRAAKLHVSEHILDPRLARLVILMLDRFSDRKRDIRPVFLARIIDQVTENGDR